MLLLLPDGHVAPAVRAPKSLRRPVGVGGWRHSATAAAGQAGDGRLSETGVFLRLFYGRALHGYGHGQLSLVRVQDEVDVVGGDVPDVERAEASHQLPQGLQVLHDLDELVAAGQVHPAVVADVLHLLPVAGDEPAKVHQRLSQVFEENMNGVAVV